LQGQQPIGGRGGAGSAEASVRDFIDRLHQLQLRVRSAPVTLRDVKVRFADGSVQDVSIRKHIPAGGERVLQKVVFWYDTLRCRSGREVVQLYGRRRRLPARKGGEACARS
jgi:hypothetical protein